MRRVSSVLSGSYSEEIETLLEAAMATPTGGDQKSEKFIWAIKNGDLDTVQNFIEHKASVTS